MDRRVQGLAGDPLTLFSHQKGALCFHGDKRLYPDPPQRAEIYRPDMSSTVILAAAAAFALGCVFCLGLWWLSTHRSKRGRTETMKATVWLCLCNGCAWVWCSYLLAYLGREQIAEQLSGKAVTEIIAVILAYAIKSILENLSKHNNWPDRSGKKEETTHE